MKKIIIGSRGSKLSLVYANKVKDLISKVSEDLDINIQTIKTLGDIHKDKKISELGGKNLFCKDIEEHLLNNKIDIAVHSLKDMGTEEHKDLTIGAFIKRNDARDVLISNGIINLSEFKKEIKIGTSSKRRELQLKKLNKNVSIVPLRGNIDTRINKVKEKKIDAIILAAAGVKSLNLEKEISLFFETNKMLPALGQGIIAVQCKKKDKLIFDLIKKIDDKNTNLCARAERKILQTIQGDCDTAIGGLAEIHGDNLRLKARLFSDLGDESFEYECSGKITDAVTIGNKIGKKLLDLAGEKFKIK